MWTTFLLVLISIVLAAGAWLLFVWAVRSGQFDDVEGQKHRILDEEEDARRGGKPGDKTPAGGSEGRPR